MQMAERYGSPTSQIIRLIGCLQVPFNEVREGDRIAIFTDDAMDPLIWQAIMAVIYSKGGQGLVCLFPRLPFHCAEPPEAAIQAAKSMDLMVALTTTSFNSGTPAIRKLRAEGTAILLMEESTVDILVDGGGRTSYQDILEICELQRRIGEIYDRGKIIKVASKNGSDFTADISGYPPGYHAKRWSKPPWTRDPQSGRLTGGTWPHGEVHVEAKPGTANGVIVWDMTAYFPPGEWKQPVALTIKDGRVVAIDGGTEARFVKKHIETHGDENAFSIGGEISLGTNGFCLPNTGNMRSEKKRYGAMHFGVGHGADRNEVNSKLRIEGIIDRVTVAVDDRIICEDGVIKV